MQVTYALRSMEFSLNEEMVKPSYGRHFDQERTEAYWRIIRAQRKNDPEQVRFTDVSTVLYGCCQNTYTCVNGCPGDTTDDGEYSLIDSNW